MHTLDVRSESVIEFLKSQLLLLTGNDDGGGADGEFLGNDGTSGSSKSHRLHLQTRHLRFATCSSASGDIDASGFDAGRDSATESKTSEGSGSSESGTSSTSEAGSSSASEAGSGSSAGSGTTGKAGT